MSPKEPIILKELRPKTLLLGVYSPKNQFRDKEAYFEEFLNLVKTLDLGYDFTLMMKVRSTDPFYFLTKGKRGEIEKFCKENQIEEVICSEILSPLQERNFSDALECSVIDRERLILEIFKKSAHTAEGKTQVAIAELEYLKTRITGKGTELSQQAGHIGTRGPGETLKESLGRYYSTNISQAKKRLKNLEKSKTVQRKRRLESKIPFITLIGYTNSGKSSLLNQLTKANVLAEDKLFATLDTTTKSLYLSPQKTILISDTVGFISDLPHHLIEAFKSTLDELQFSNLLLHVVDINNPIWPDQIKVVEKTLKELNVKKPTVFVFNKIDKVKNLKEIKVELEDYKPYILTSAVSKKGVKTLVDFLKNYEF
jgi:GTPase